jgi:hypothetical protein
MGEPPSSDGPKAPGSETPSATPETPVLSIPDRRRIDSDVRAFLREPSTPWIVFDQEGRPPSQLAVGEVLRGPRKTLLSDYDFFPATAAADAAAAHKLLEPSSVSLAADLSADSRALAPLTASQADVELADVSPIPKWNLNRRIVGAAAAAVGVLSILAIGTLALRSTSPNTAALRNAAVAQPAQRSFGAAVPAEIPPPDLDVKPAPVAAAAPAAPAPVVIPTPIAAAAAAPASASWYRVEPPKAGVAASKYGRLTITGDARSKDVFMDGKRMLGRGTRNFSIVCGAHTIGIGVRSDSHDVEIPCGAELVVGK